jgi:methionyl-tRNA synthetase
MIDIENGNALSASTLASASTPTPAEPVTTASSHPAAAPRTSSLDEPSGTLPVGGSSAEKPALPSTPGAHHEAPASGPFAGAAAQSAGNGAASSPQITIDDFAKVELRVAQVIVAERIPKADKLLRLEVDLGYEKRQILSGIAEWYTPEDLVGRRIVVITNLAPRKMRGLESHGMLLAASEGDGGKPVLATFGEEIALGSRLK